MNPNQTFEQLFAQQLAENPQQQAMFSLLQQMRENRENENEAERNKTREVVHCKKNLAKAVSKIKSLQLEVAELNEALAAADQFEENLANALGACVFCWGEDAQCRACLGKGKPGIFEPDPALFEQFVAPVLRRRRMQLQ